MPDQTHSITFDQDGETSLTSILTKPRFQRISTFIRYQNSISLAPRTLRRSVSGPFESLSTAPGTSWYRRLKRGPSKTSAVLRVNTEERSEGGGRSREGELS